MRFQDFKGFLISGNVSTHAPVKGAIAGSNVLTGHAVVWFQLTHPVKGAIEVIKIK